MLHHALDATGLDIVTDPERIVYTEHMMRKEGYAPRQIWRRGADETEVVPGGNV